MDWLPNGSDAVSNVVGDRGVVEGRKPNEGGKRGKYRAIQACIVVVRGNVPKRMEGWLSPGCSRSLKLAGL